MALRISRKQKGVSPVIAEVVLIGIVILLGMIIFVWMKSLAKETVTKFGEENIELSCDKVAIEAGYNPSTGNLTITNTGNIPIYRMLIKISKTGSSKTEKIQNNWKKYGLGEGQSYTGSFFNLKDAEEASLIPVLLGVNEEGKKRTYTCGKSEYKLNLY